MFYFIILEVMIRISSCKKKNGKFNKDINVIPNNMEKYMTFMIDKNIIFIDSFQFMDQSLSNLK